MQIVQSQDSLCLNAGVYGEFIESMANHSEYFTRIEKMNQK